MSADTPGPFPVLYLRDQHGVLGPLVEVVDMDGSVVKRHVIGAQADLLNAAPELLAKCEMLLALYDETDRTHEAAYYAFFKDGSHEMWESVRAAIAKARGW